MDIRDIFLLSLVAYLGFGQLFALWFVFKGVQSMDPVASKTPLVIRLVWLPGAALVWPLLAAKSKILLRSASKETSA